MDIGIKTVFNLFIFFIGMLLLTLVFSMFILKHHANHVLNEVIEEIEINGLYDNAIADKISNYVKTEGFDILITEIIINNKSIKYNVIIKFNKYFTILNYIKTIQLEKTTRIIYF